MIDGFSGSGKSLVAAIFGYLDRSEQWQINEIYEYISILNYIGDISDNSTSAILNIEADKHLYNLMIGRNVNSRNTDVSSPYNDGLYERYLSRTKKNDGDQIITEIKKVRPILPLHVHYVFGYSDILLRGFNDRLKLYILILRNPFTIIEAWHQGNWVNRMCKVDREFTLCCSYKRKLIPWFATEYADEYINSTDLEKAILTVYQLYTRIISMYSDLSDSRKKKMMIIFFERFIINPELYIDKICDILETQRNDDFEKIMAKLSLPRKSKDANSMSLSEFIESYEKELSDKFIGILKDLEDKYSSFLHKIP